MLVGLLLKLRTEIRMCDGDERFCALRDRLSLQVDHAVFRDDVHHVGARRGDDVAGRQVQYDAAAGRAPLAIG